mgnify:CR=1 FL=1
MINFKCLIFFCKELLMNLNSHKVMPSADYKNLHHPRLPELYGGQAAFSEMMEWVMILHVVCPSVGRSTADGISLKMWLLVSTTPPARGGHPFNPCHRHSCGRKGTLLLRRKEKISSQFNLPLGRKEYINRTSETLALGWELYSSGVKKKSLPSSTSRLDGKNI